MMMESELIFHPGFWFVVLSLLVTGFPVFIFTLWKSWKLAGIYPIGFLCFGIYLAFYCARNFGGAFGAGMTVGYLSALIMPISIILWVLMRHSFRQKFSKDARRLKMYLFGSVIVILTQLLPWFGSFAISSACFKITQHNAIPLVEAIKRHRQQTGGYPSALDDLIPSYLRILPTPACSWLSKQDFRSQIGYELISCPNGRFLLANLSMDGTAIERYQFSNRTWSSIGFFDGACSHIP